MRQIPECAARLRTIRQKAPTSQTLYDTKLINVRGTKYRNVTFEDKFLDKEELSKYKIFVGYLDFHMNSKQTAKPGLSMSDCRRQMGSG